MGSNGVKSKVVLMVLIAGTVPVVLFFARGVCD